MKTRIIFIILLICTISFANAQLLEFFAPKELPQSNHEAFVRYFRGGYLTSGAYSQFLNPGKAVEHLEGASLVGLRYSWSKFAAQEYPTASPVITFGLLDNISALQGSVNKEPITSPFVDIASLSSAYTLPLFNYSAYVNVGVKAAASYNAPFCDSINTLGTNFRYITAFNDDGLTRTAAKNEPYLGFSGEAALRMGVRVYYNWFVSLALGLRQTAVKEGKWFLASDVKAWETGAEYYPPEYNYWEDNTLPENNFFLHGSSYFLSLSVSPFY